MLHASEDDMIAKLICTQMEALVPKTAEDARRYCPLLDKYDVDDVSIDSLLHKLQERVMVI